MHVQLMYLCLLSVTIIDATENSDEEYAQIGKAGIELDGISCCLRECNLADYLLDTYFNYGAPIIRKWTDQRNEKEETKKKPIIVMLNCGAIRSSINKGPIYKGHLSAVLPDPIEMGWVTMPGSHIRRAIEHAVENYDEKLGSENFLQQYGLFMNIDPSKQPGQRIFHRIPVLPTNKPLDDAAEYIVILSKHMWENMGSKYKFDKNLKFQNFEKSLFDVAENAIIDKKMVQIVKLPGNRISVMPNTGPPK